MDQYDPWVDLVAREHIIFTRHPVADAAGGAIYAQRDGRGIVILSPSLDRPDRRAVLAHELVHDERRVLAPDATPATMVREEAIVRRITAERLVPLDELAAFCGRRSSFGEPVLARDIAEEFDCPVSTAIEAMYLLDQRPGRTA